MKDWIDSKTIKYLVLTWLASTLLQIVPMFQNHQIDWWDLGAQSLATLAAIIVRMAQPDLVTGVPILDRRNPKL